MVASTIRGLALLALVAVAVGVIAFGFRRDLQTEHPRLAWVATARQLGPVGYRDPAGAISPDGKWLAYSEGRFLRVRPTNGGPIVDLPPAEAQIRYLTWHPDGRTILADGFLTQTGWAQYDRIEHNRRPLWAGRETLTAAVDGEGTESSSDSIRLTDLRQPVWSPDGRTIAAVVNGRESQELWIVSADGQSARARRMEARIAFPAWTPRGEVACVTSSSGRSRVTIPCGGRPIPIDPDHDAYGPIAFSSDGTTVYVGLANSAGTLDLWAAPTAGGRARQLTSFSRDSYAPSVASNGAVVFKVQSYRTFVALAPSGGGATEMLATFQSETPSWDPTGKWVGITYGTWRRVVDDANYPDIAQDVGIIAADSAQPAAAPSQVVHASASEDQSLSWSPNGRWIAFHSHKDQSDDIWVRPTINVEGPARRISFLGRGAETGWPRWSVDGRSLIFVGIARDTRRPAMFVVGVDQETGTVTSEARAIVVRGVEALVSHAEWLADSGHVVAIGTEAPGGHIIFTVGRDGSDARVIHRFASEHDSPGLAVSPKGSDVAFIAPAPDGFFQVFRMPIAGGIAKQVTSDPSNKTQPAWSPDGGRLAFTVWSYDAQFWSLR